MAVARSRAFPSPIRPAFLGSAEKAYAEKQGGYGALDTLTLNDIWKVVVGKRPTGFEVNEKTAVATINCVAKSSKKIPTVAASRTEAKTLTGWHGHAILGMQRSEIELYDPFSASRREVSLKVFRENIEAVLRIVFNKVLMRRATFLNSDRSGSYIGIFVRGLILHQYSSAVPTGNGRPSVSSSRRVAQSDLLQIIHLGLAGLNASQTPLHLVAVLQTAGPGIFETDIKAI